MTKPNKKRKKRKTNTKIQTTENTKTQKKLYIGVIMPNIRIQCIVKMKVGVNVREK